MKTKLSVAIAVWVMFLSAQSANSGEALDEIRARGEIRHLGVSYANFNTTHGEGFSAELVKRFAGYLGVKYKYVPSEWAGILPSLTGKKIKVEGDSITHTGDMPVTGDLIETGMTVLPWRTRVIDFSVPIFPTQVWLIARIDSKIHPIKPSGDLGRDMAETKRMLSGVGVLCKKGTCLDPSLYGIAESVGRIRFFDGSLNDMAGVVMSGEIETALLDVPDCLVAMQKWPGKIKIIGPVSAPQDMAAAFRKDSPELRNEFNRFIAESRKNGSFKELVMKYYPDILSFFPDFFSPGK